MTRMAAGRTRRDMFMMPRMWTLNASKMPLALISLLYDIERRSTDCSMKPHGDSAKESKLVLNRLGDWLDGPVATSVLPSSKLGHALNHVRNHWEALNEYIEDGRLPIDNNWVERLMKRVARG